jgi:hypothetical protein
MTGRLTRALDRSRLRVEVGRTADLPILKVGVIVRRIPFTSVTCIVALTQPGSATSQLNLPHGLGMVRTGLRGRQPVEKWTEAGASRAPAPFPHHHKHQAGRLDGLPTRNR